MSKGKILKNFDLDAIRRQRARSAASGGVNLVDAINQISPEIGKLNVGETVELPVEGGKPNLRKSVMAIVAKLNNLTPKGGEWEGRTYDVVSDGESNIYVQRGPDLKGADIPVRNRRGPTKKTETPAEAAADAAKGETVKVEGGATVTERKAAA